MKASLFNFKLVATKMYMPELDKGERNPYTSGDEIGNPYMKDKEIIIEDEHVQEVLDLLQRLEYDVSKMKLNRKEV